jgi:hypothetical protein
MAALPSIRSSRRAGEGGLCRKISWRNTHNFSVAFLNMATRSVHLIAVVFACQDQFIQLENDRACIPVLHASSSVNVKPSNLAGLKEAHLAKKKTPNL